MVSQFHLRPLNDYICILHQPHHRYIAGEEIPVEYGGLKRENDPDFSTNDGVSDVTVKAGSTETIEIPIAEVSQHSFTGRRLIDMMEYKFSPSLIHRSPAR